MTVIALSKLDEGHHGTVRACPRMAHDVDTLLRVVTEAQQEVCERYGVAPVPTPDELKVGFARGGSGPLNGLRHPLEGDTAGWYIWRGELLAEDDFFSPLRAAHLKDEVPEVVRFLALPPG